MNRVGAAGPSPASLPDGGAIQAAVPIGGLNVAMRVMALRTANRQEEERNATEGIQSATAERRVEMEARLQQTLRALQARDDASWWQDLGAILKVVGVVASVAVGVAGAAFSGGTSVLAAAAVIAALTAVQYGAPYLANEIGEACGADPKTMMWVNLGVSLACVVISLLMPTNTAGATADAIVRIGRAAGDVAEGGCRIVSATYVDQEGRHNASAARHGARAQAAENGLQEGLEDLQAILDRAARASRAAVAMMMGQNEGARSALRA